MVAAEALSWSEAPNGALTTLAPGAPPCMARGPSAPAAQAHVGLLRP